MTTRPGEGVSVRELLSRIRGNSAGPSKWGDCAGSEIAHGVIASKANVNKNDLTNGIGRLIIVYPLRSDWPGRPHAQQGPANAIIGRIAKNFHGCIAKKYAHLQAPQSAGVANVPEICERGVTHDRDPAQGESVRRRAVGLNLAGRDCKVSGILRNLGNATVEAAART